MITLEESFDGTFTDNIKSTNYKSQFATKKHKIVINVSETQYAVVKHVTKKNKWFLNTDPVSTLNFDICWVDGIARSDLFAKMNQYQKINHFPGMGILSRKNNLGKNLMLFRKRFPDDYEFFPITWHLPYDYADLQNYHECRQQGKAQTFIVKPEAGCQGRGIHLTRNIEKLKNNQKCVVQRYLHKPYLIDGLKFDLRIYVLITGIDPLRIFVFEEGLARFATQPYKPPRSQNIDNFFMHLTNYAINKNSQNFVFNESVNEMGTGHKRSLTSIYKHLEQQGHDVELLKEKINDIFIKTIITGYPTLSQTLTSVHPDNHANDMCFEVLGFDIMLDHKLNPYILQINYTPSFTADTPLDRYIKKRLITDTLNLVGVNEKWKKECKMKRDKEIQERMVTGKRKKYTFEQRKILMKEEAERRNEWEKKNMGSYKKIFILSEQQFMEYKKYYDFAMQVSESIGKNESFPAYQKPVANPFVFYNNYFDDQIHVKALGKEKKSRDRESLKNGKPPSRSSKMNDSKIYQRVNMMSATLGEGYASHSTKRVTSAKSKNDKKERKIVYDNRSSNKSLKLDRSSEKGDSYGDKMENDSMFQNKMIENVLSKQKSKNEKFSEEQNI